ncbi:MarR family transcriptional regulator (plasmid) [Deinococcus taeanensis]|uniref:MarR family winged helix-turn-helix transcriptional regulator n=1 Tax=Deinococcus taeanensis TaxID=2737050 RepID=UPI001CDC7F8C|nr:MarR family transcriptional regulator [Deinococcus taeanensis]UBV44762.1 MarR family transcriptional regulator [Deinococcus taeanensis]
MTTDLPHPPLEHPTYLALQVLALRLEDDVADLLKQGGLSVTQFNVLRILRGAGERALTCGDIAAQLLNKDPDVTRLLDRMDKLGLVERFRSEHDRRVLLTPPDPSGPRHRGPLRRAHSGAAPPAVPDPPTGAARPVAQALLREVLAVDAV